MKNQTRWNEARRKKYASLLHQWRPYDSKYERTAEHREAVKYNGIKSGKHSAAAVAIRRLLYDTEQLIKVFKM